MSKYSDIMSDGGLDPRNEYEAKRNLSPLRELQEQLTLSGKVNQDLMKQVHEQQAEIEALKKQLADNHLEPHEWDTIFFARELAEKMEQGK